MTQKLPIDSAWFRNVLARRRESLRAPARFMQMDAAAVSRMLNGQRGMSAAEQDKLAAFLVSRSGRVAAASLNLCLHEGDDDRSGCCRSDRANRSEIRMGRKTLQ